MTKANPGELAPRTEGVPFTVPLSHGLGQPDFMRVAHATCTAIFSLDETIMGEHARREKADAMSTLPCG
jgi:hypothetical protein